MTLLVQAAAHHVGGLVVGDLADVLAGLAQCLAGKGGGRNRALIADRAGPIAEGAARAEELSVRNLWKCTA